MCKCKRKCSYCVDPLPAERGCQHGISMFCDELCRNLFYKTKENLVAHIEYPGWRLVNWSNVRAHWTKHRKANQPPIELVKLGATGYVTGPHPRRRVEILRVGPHKLDRDGLFTSIKPAIDRLKCAKWRDHDKKLHVGAGWLWDDSEEFAEIVPTQQVGEYGVIIKVWEL